MLNDLGLLLLRLTLGLMLFFMHGWGKLINFSASAAHFPDPLHVGGTVSLSVAVLAEVVCALMVTLGLFTRVAAVLPGLMLLVAAFVVHAADPLAKKELALLYALCYLSLVLTGPGSM